MSKEELLKGLDKLFKAAASERVPVTELLMGAAGGGGVLPPRDLFYPRSIYDVAPNCKVLMWPTIPWWSPTAAYSHGQLAFDLGGRATTGDDGCMAWKLSECVEAPCPHVEEPVSFVATPTSDNKPVYLTTRVEIAPEGNDLLVEVLAWDSAGKPAGRIPFSWWCRVPYYTLVL